MKNVFFLICLTYSSLALSNITFDCIDPAEISVEESRSVIGTAFLDYYVFGQQVGTESFGLRGDYRSNAKDQIETSLELAKKLNRKVDVTINNNGGALDFENPGFSLDISEACKED